MTEPLTLKASVDRPLAWEAGESARYIVATLDGEAPARAGRNPAPPVNLAIAVDASGSMGGAKLEHAKAAARGVAARLRDGDRLTVVSFANDTIVHADAVAVSAATRPAILAAIDRLESRGCTNLSEGWLTGAERVALAAGQGLNRVIVLSDGMANEGITDSDELATHAAALAARGIMTSTVGIGNGYHGPVLQALAEHGGGRLHDAEHGIEIVDALLGELGEMGDLAAQNVTVTLSVPATARASLVGSAPATVGVGTLSVFAGALAAGQPRQVVFRVILPAGRAGATVHFGLTARGAGPDGQPLVAAAVEVSFTFAEGARNSRQDRDIAASMAVARAWHADIVRTAARMNREGERRQVASFLDRELRFFERYCQGLPDAPGLLREIILLRRNAGRDWDERTRKDMEFASYAAVAGKRDHRSAPRDSWASRFSRGE